MRRSASDNRNADKVFRFFLSAPTKNSLVIQSEAVNLLVKKSVTVWQTNVMATKYIVLSPKTGHNKNQQKEYVMVWLSNAFMSWLLWLP